MTNPTDLERLRDEAFAHYRTHQLKVRECPMCSDLSHGFKAGFDKAVELLQQDAQALAPFDEREAEIASLRMESKRRDFAFVEGAKWMFNKLAERVRVSEQMAKDCQHEMRMMISATIRLKDENARLRQQLTDEREQGAKVWEANEEKKGRIRELEAELKKAKELKAHIKRKAAAACDGDMAHSVLSAENVRLRAALEAIPCGCAEYAASPNMMEHIECDRCKALSGGGEG